MNEDTWFVVWGQFNVRGPMKEDEARRLVRAELTPKGIKYWRIFNGAERQFG